MINEYKTIKCRLDGENSVSIPVDIRKNGQYVTEPVDVLVRGFVKFSNINNVVEENKSNELVDKTIVYPVLFSSDKIRVNNGRCIVTILPRSEDIFETTSTIQSSANISDENIISQGGISADEQITDPEKEPVIIKIETGTIRTPYKLSIEITVVAVDSTNIYDKTIDRGTNPQIEETNDIMLLFQKHKQRSASNIIIECFNDSDYVPSVTSILYDNNSSKDDALTEINNLQNSTPFGLSTMYDAVVVGARIMAVDSVTDKRKIVYLFTDNEANISIASLDNSIDEINNIDGYKQVPVLISNMAVVQPETLSVKANTSDTKNINKLAFLTGGQSLTATSEEFLDDIAGIFYREAVGALGYGVYQFVVDLEEESLINSIVTSFDIIEDSNATWSIETSTDGNTYTAIDKTNSYSTTVEYENLFARYIKFKIILISAISSEVDEYGTTPDSPALTRVQIVYNKKVVKYLYLNKEESENSLYHTTLAVDASDTNTGQIKTGIASSDSHNWVDYNTDSKQEVEQNGKVVIPLRFSEDITEFPQEPLKKIDNFNLKTEYGQFDAYSNVIVYDKLDNVIPTNYYKLQPRQGWVIMNTALPSDYVDGDYKIGILNTGDYKVGLKLTNKTKEENLEVYGIGYMYTTTKDLLPPLAKAIPEVNNVIITNEIPNKYSIIEASYNFIDSNFDIEDISRRQIRWFINGVPIKYLEGLTKFNDIANPLDPIYTETSLEYPIDLGDESIIDNVKRQGYSILNSKDKVHYEIIVSDGVLNSNKVKSNVINVVPTIPILGSFTLKGRDENGNLVDRITSNTSVVISPPVNEILISDSSDNKSEITWIVNNDVFKTGTVGDTNSTGIPIEEVWVNEIGSMNYIDYGIRILNNISVEITPISDGASGRKVTSPNIVVKNSLPLVYDLNFITSSHNKNQDIIVQWNYYDFEVTSIGDVDSSNQYDRSSVKWYRKNSDESDFTLVYIYNDIDNNFQETFPEVVPIDYYRTKITTDLNSRVSKVDNEVVQVDQKWKCVVIPHDALDPGTEVVSETITITSNSN